MIYSESPKAWVLALFKRSDGTRLLLGDGAFEFKSSQQHFSANSYVNDTVEVQGADGTLLAGQVRRAGTQSFDGYIGDATLTATETENKRREFLAFFRKDYFYEVVYILADGRAIKRQRGYIVDAPEVKELFELSPEYHVALNFEDVNYYEYLEDSEGTEIYGHTATVAPSETVSGGIIWDTVGATWDTIGMVWETGGGDKNDIYVESIDYVYPILTFPSGTESPTIENSTTKTTMSYAGTVAEGQTLVINTQEQTALLNGVSVMENISGDWFSLSNGRNRITYTTDNDAPSMTIQWSEVVG